MRSATSRQLLPRLLGLTAALLAACGSESPESTVEHDRFCAEYAQRSCAVAEGCGCPGPDTTPCESLMQAECARWAEEPVSAGRVTYDPTPGGQCLSAIETAIADCSRAGDAWPQACDDMLQGIVPDGSACESDDECVDELECWNARCLQPPTDGMPCVDDSVCATNHFCGDDLLCHGNRAAGEPCGEGDYVCGESLLCDSRTSTCEPYLIVGDSCAHNAYACADDLYCSAASETCRSIPTAGGDCLDSGGGCAEGFYCDLANLCQPQRPGGAACLGSEECASWSCVDDVCEAGLDADSICANEV